MNNTGQVLNMVNNDGKLSLPTPVPLVVCLIPVVSTRKYTVAFDGEEDSIILDLVEVVLIKKPTDNPSSSEVLTLPSSPLMHGEDFYSAAARVILQSVDLYTDIKKMQLFTSKITQKNELLTFVVTEAIQLEHFEQHLGFSIGSEQQKTSDIAVEGLNANFEFVVHKEIAKTFLTQTNVSHVKTQSFDWGDDFKSVIYQVLMHEGLVDNVGDLFFHP